MRSAGLELELGWPVGHVGALLVLGDKAEGGLAGQGRIGRVGARRRVDPAAAGDKAAARVVDHGQGAGRVRVIGAVVDHEADVVDARPRRSGGRRGASAAVAVAEIPGVGQGIVLGVGGAAAVKGDAALIASRYGPPAISRGRPC